MNVFVVSPNTTIQLLVGCVIIHCQLGFRCKGRSTQFIEDSYFNTAHEMLCFCFANVSRPFYSITVSYPWATSLCSSNPRILFTLQSVTLSSFSAPGSRQLVFIVYLLFILY